ncbi:MAG: hypothetical protein ACRDHE_01170, partial [Ktedonobacterales bacterium]
YTAEIGEDRDAAPGSHRPRFKFLSGRRMAECQEQCRCILCGFGLNAEAAVIWDEELSGVVDDWQHPRCARLALAHCPHLRAKAETGQVRVICGPLAELRVLPRIVTSEDDVDSLVTLPALA